VCWRTSQRPSWRVLVDKGASIEPARASQAIRATAASQELTARYGATTRLTGEQPLADEEFASVKDGAALDGVAALIVMLVIEWLALRPGRSERRRQDLYVFNPPWEAVSCYG